VLNFAVQTFVKGAAELCPETFASLLKLCMDLGVAGLCELLHAEDADVVANAAALVKTLAGVTPENLARPIDSLFDVL
jgi:hypothetical protein